MTAEDQVHADENEIDLRDREPQFASQANASVKQRVHEVHKPPVATVENGLGRGEEDVGSALSQGHAPARRS
jgi:hypothetical protein